VFLPVTRLCRDRCHYCVFVDTPGGLARAGEPEFMSAEDILEIAREGARLGCKEALFTLGDRPEDRWPAARRWLDEHGFASTLDYVGAMADLVLKETGLVPHLNPGVMSWAEMQRLRPFAGSMGMMLETTATRLWSEPGGVHFGSPDKDPALRLRVIEDAGRSRIPFTTGVLLGIGEDDRDRAESLVAIRALNDRFGHVQETIVQNFRAKPRTAMQNEPDLEIPPYIAAVATARVVMGPDATIQAPPNLTDEHELGLLIRAGIDDWGGVSPLTADHVNPERPWPEIDLLAALTARSGYTLRERLTAHPRYLRDADQWLDPYVRPALEALVDPATHLADETARVSPRPAMVTAAPDRSRASRPESGQVRRALDAAREGNLDDDSAAVLLGATGDQLDELAAIADDTRAAAGLDAVTYVVNRNIDSSQIGRTIDRDGLVALVEEAVAIGATEVCLQGLPAPEFSPLDVVRTVRATGPQLAVHAFRPPELVAGAARAGLSLGGFLGELIEAGVTSTPGTAARVLDDEVRAFLSEGQDPPAAEWIRTIEEVHRAGLHTTATLVYGHVETPAQIVRHLRTLAGIQARTGGFREFIPMPFVGSDATKAVRARAGDGPAPSRSRAVIAVSRLLLAGSIGHVQAAWTKLGLGTTVAVLRGGADDLGGVLLDGQLNPSAGPETGLSLRGTDLEWISTRVSRPLRERTTDYARVSVSA
jgi:FO synthase